MFHRSFLLWHYLSLQSCSTIAKSSSCCWGDLNHLVFTCFKIGSVGLESWTGRFMLCCSTGLLLVNMFLLLWECSIILM